MDTNSQAKMADELNSNALTEVLFDISYSFGHCMNGFAKSGALMDMLEGSRGLKDRIVLWAAEFQSEWDLRPEDEKQDYLAEIDDFADKKWRGLLDELKRYEAKADVASEFKVATLAAPDLTPADVIVTAIQVVPIIDNGGAIEPQFEGPNEFTTGWGVYARNSFGLVNHIVDVPHSDGYATAMLIGGALAMKYEVEIEPQPWVKKDEPEQKYEVTWVITVTASSPRQAAERAREMQLEPDSTANIFTVDVRGSQVPQQDIDLSVPA